jgi:hypothetical protein
VRLEDRYPRIFRWVVYNMIKAEVMDFVDPLPMTPSAAYYLVRRFVPRADMIYIETPADVMNSGSPAAEGFAQIGSFA